MTKKQKHTPLRPVLCVPFVESVEQVSQVTTTSKVLSRALGWPVACDHSSQVRQASKPVQKSITATSSRPKPKGVYGWPQATAFFTFFFGSRGVRRGGHQPFQTEIRLCLAALFFSLAACSTHVTTAAAAAAAAV